MNVPLCTSCCTVLLYFSGFCTVRLKIFLCLFFMYYLCEKHYQPVAVQYYMANCVSCIPRLTLLDLMNWLLEQKLFTCRGLTVSNCSVAKSVEKTIFSTINFPLYFFPKIDWPSICGTISGLFILFHWFFCLLTCRSCSVLEKVGLNYVLISDRAFLLFSDVPFCFHLVFHTNLTSFKNTGHNTIY